MLSGVSLLHGNLLSSLSQRQDSCNCLLNIASFFLEIVGSCFSSLRRRFLVFSVIFLAAWASLPAGGFYPVATSRFVATSVLMCVKSWATDGCNGESAVIFQNKYVQTEIINNTEVIEQKLSYQMTHGQVVVRGQAVGDRYSTSQPTHT